MINVKPNEVFKLYVNDYLYVNLFYNGKVLLVRDAGNCKDADMIDITQNDDVAFISIGGVLRGSMDLHTGELKTAHQVIPTTALRNFDSLVETVVETSNQLSDGTVKEPELKELRSNIKVYSNNLFRFKDRSGTIDNKTELHTHFMEILSGREFLDIIFKYVKSIGIDEHGELVTSYPLDKTNPKILDTSNAKYWLSKEELEENHIVSSKVAFDLTIDKLATYLNFHPSKTGTFEDLNDILQKRSALLELAAYTAAYREIYSLNGDESTLVTDVREKINKAKIGIYVNMLVKSLRSLRHQGVKYVELSFSNPKTIIAIQEAMKDYQIPGITYSFLLSENRSYKYSNFKNAEKLLPEMIKKGYVCGFDLMGMEKPITSNDYKPNSPGHTSLYDKLEGVLTSLNSLNDNSVVCRLHAGEVYFESDMKEKKSNPEKTLEILDQIVSDKGLKVPPPSIRLGHAQNIIKTDNYLNLLRKYNVTIEINATSNFALGNTKDLSSIPYKWYLDNGINVVLSTDGSGFYSTTIKDEARIANAFTDTSTVKKVLKSEKEELTRRGM